MESSPALSNCVDLGMLFDKITAFTLEIHHLTDELELLKTTVRETRNLLNCDRVFIYQFLPARDGVIIAESVKDPWPPILGQLVYDPCFSEKWIEPYRQGKISVVEDIYTQTTESCYIQLLERFQARANLVVPIVIGKPPQGNLWGLLIAHQCERPRQWQTAEVKGLQNIAVNVGIALKKFYIIPNQPTETPEQRELRCKEALLRSMTDSSLLGFYVVDNRTDNIIYSNHRFREIWGIEHLETPMNLGQVKNNDIIPDCIPLIADLPAFVESCKPLQREENRAIIEDEIKFTDGRTIRRFSSQVRDIDDRYFGRLYIFEDVTERKRIEEALRESEERYRSVIKSMGEGIVLQQADGQIIACNQSAQVILGLTEEQMMGRTSVDSRWHTFHEDGYPFPGEEHPAMMTLKTGQPQKDVIMGVYKPDGQMTWISINSQPLLRPDEVKPYAVVTSFSDITEKRQLELDLRQSEALFRGLFEQATVGAGLVDSSGKFIRINDRFCHLLGYSQEELAQLNFMEITHPDDREINKKYNIQFWTKGIPYSTDKRYIRKDGQIQWVNLTGSPIYDVNGQLQYALGIVIDISARKEAENTIHQQTERERMINAITHHIHESLDLYRILQTTVTEVREFLQADRVIIYRLNPDWSGTVVNESVLPKYLSILNIKITDSYFVETQGGTYHNRKINNVSDIHQAGLTPCHVELMEKLQVRAKLVVPILQDAHTWGLLIAHDCHQPRQWQPVEIDLLYQLATQLAIAIQQSELHHSLELKNKELENLVLVDSLTQIANRRCFDHDFSHEWQRSLREKAPLSLLFCDIDYFKQYNDTYQHQVGDECLKQVAQTLQKAAKRVTDLVARYGGEEFVIILPNTDTEGAIKVASDIKEAIQAVNIPHVASQVASHVTLSIGIATRIPSPDQSPENLIESADSALFQAKKQGRDRYIIHNS